MNVGSAAMRYAPHLAALLLLLSVHTTAQVPTQSYLRNKPSEANQEDPRVSDIIARAEGHFKAGETHLLNDKPVAARAEFNKALDSILEVGIDIRADKKLGAYYLELVERIYKLESSVVGLSRPKTPLPGFVEQRFEPSPQDALAITAPAKTALPAGFGAASVIELRGLRVGMSIAEVKTKIPTLKPDPPDEFNSATAFVRVKSDRYLSALPSLKDVRAISVEFLDQKVSFIGFVYENTARWEEGEAFAAQIARALSLKSGWRKLKEDNYSPLDDLHYMYCQDVMIVAGLKWISADRYPSVSVLDINAQRRLGARLREATERRRELEERRRRTFKP